MRTEELAQLQRRHEHLEMKWNAEHAHALEFSADILSTCAALGDHWLSLRTHAQIQAAQFLAARGLAELHPAERHLARFVTTEKPIDRRVQDALGPSEGAPATR